MSSGVDAASLGLELQSQEAIGPGSAVVKLNARTENVEHTPEADLSMGMAKKGTAATLPSDGENGVVHTDAEDAAEGDRMGSVSPLFDSGGHWRIVRNG